MPILRSFLCALACAILLTACATTPPALDPRHDPANPAAAEGSATPVTFPLSQPVAMPANAAHTSPSGKTIYTCPMHPEVQEDHPGSCPKCGMTLVIKKDGN